MRRIHIVVGVWVTASLVLLQSGCFFSGGVTTVSKTTSASSTGILSATEQNGQWDADGPPPRVGEVTERPIYRSLQKESAYSFGGAFKGYDLSDPYPRGRYRIAAIREVGTAAESSGTVHYYEVEFDVERASSY
jgi:hypothetical protein